MLLAIVLPLSLSACGDGTDFQQTGTDPTGDATRSTPGASDGYKLSGSVSGLISGAQVTLQNNGRDAVVISADGRFTFPEAIPANGGYAVTVTSQSPEVSCAVLDNSGIGSGVQADVDSVSVACAPRQFSIGGTVSGLVEGGEIHLLNNGADPLAMSANGAFNFPARVSYSGSYAVTVASQPAGQVCTVAQAHGVAVTRDVDAVAVTCSDVRFEVTGIVSGLDAGQQVTLVNNGVDPVQVAADGSLSFPTPVAYGSSYNITVSTQPTGQICSVANGAGTLIVSQPPSVNVVCSTATYTVSGVLSQLNNSGQVTLLNNGTDPLTLTADGFFTFSTPVVYGSPYDVTVGMPPVGRACTVFNGTGQALANVVDLTVICWTIGSGGET